MEEKLFWIGIVTGAFAWLLATTIDRKTWHTRGATAALHAVFVGCSAFAATLILLFSLESRRNLNATPGTLTPGNVVPAMAALAAGAAWGAFSAWKRGSKEDARKGILEDDKEWADTVFSAVLLAAFLMYFIVQAFKIPSGSMRQTLLEGDHLFVSKFLYGVRIPFTGVRLLRIRPVERGDIAVFEFPSQDPEELHCGSSQSGKDFIKRVVAVPGDTVQVQDGVLHVNGKALDEEYAQWVDPIRIAPPHRRLTKEEYQAAWERRELDSSVGDGVRDHFGPVTVPEGSYFMMGDNRDRSCDSRFWGPVPDRKMKGKAWFLYWPPGRMRRIL